VKYNGRSGDNYDAAADPYAVSVPEGMTAREALGARMRAAYTAQTGYDHEDATDAELLDALVYNVFPNFAPWGGFMPNIVYRWRPGKTPDTCIMEVRILMRVKKGEKHPRGVPMKFLRWTRNGPKRPNWASWATCLSRTWTTCPMSRKGSTPPRPAKCNWATTRKSASASSSRRWIAISASPKAATEPMRERDAARRPPRRIDCVLICGGVWHDIDFARLELLKLLADDPAVRTRVFEDYENIAAIEAADILITYTCDITPSLPAQEALKAWLARGGRWYALHGTNSVLRLLSDGPNAGLWDAPRWAPLFMDLLGSQFISHPPIAPYRVEVADPDHPLVQGWKRSRPRTSSITSKPTAISTCCWTPAAPSRAPASSRPTPRPAAIRCSTSSTTAQARCSTSRSAIAGGIMTCNRCSTGGPAWTAAPGTCRCSTTCCAGAWPG
jgi:hypothetical protein